MLDYLGTSERLQEAMTYYRVEYEDEKARQKAAERQRAAAAEAEKERAANAAF